MHSVVILNPPAGFPKEISLKRALRFERQCRAEFVTQGVVRMISIEVRDAAKKREEKTQKWASTNPGYDRIGLSFAEYLRAIPVVNREKMIRQERSTRNWSFSAGVWKGRSVPHRAALQRKRIVEAQK